MNRQSLKNIIAIFCIVFLGFLVSECLADDVRPWKCDISEKEATQIVIDFLKSEIGWSEESIRESFSIDGGCVHEKNHWWMRYFMYKGSTAVELVFRIDAHDGTILLKPIKKELELYKNHDNDYLSGEWTSKEKEWLQQMEAKYQTSSKYWDYKIWHELQSVYPLCKVFTDYALPSSDEISYDQAVQIFINEYIKYHPDLDEKHIVCLSSKFIKDYSFYYHLPPEPNYWIMEFYEKNDFRDTPVEDRYLARAIITSEHGYLFFSDARRDYPYQEISTVDDFWR